MKHYYFIGIAGIGMSGLAKILLEKGSIVEGSDPAYNKQTAALEGLGAKIYREQDGSHLTKEIDLVIVTSAIKEDNGDLIKARELGLRIFTRSELLNEIITSQKSIAVTGTHGKTTTSSMIATILEEANLDPTAVIGADVRAISGNAKYGKGKFSIAEVCEYQRAFLDIYPDIAIITNIEEDHLDCYKDLNDIVTTFTDFVSHINKGGELIVFGEDKNIESAIKNYSGRVIKYGFQPANNWVAKNIEFSESKTTFEVEHDGKNLGKFIIIIPGTHNILNALAAIAVCSSLGLNMDSIKRSLEGFTGASRRFQIMGELNGTIFVDDYGHHPTEIQATLEGAKEFYPGRRIIAVFQPHQHSRTKLLMEDFSKSFKKADLVLIPEIYAVRDTEEDIRLVSSRNLVEKINEISPQKAKFFNDFEETANYLRENIKPNDLVITIGAGPVSRVGELLLVDRTVEN